MSNSKLNTFTCMICGEEFQTTAFNAKACSVECRKEKEKINVKNRMSKKCKVKESEHWHRAICAFCHTCVYDRKKH